MRLVMTLLVRDEADVVDANVAYHLDAGVDMVVATDNGSIDGTTEILERYERTGRLLLIHEPEHNYRQGAWVTRMARIAATDLGADWVLHNDADQFWWPAHASLREVFASIPDEYGILAVPKVNFLPRDADGTPGTFADRLTIRHAFPDLRPGDRAPRGTSIAVAHRADPQVQVGQGNHRLLDSPLRRLPQWYPIVILHFPRRSYAQFERMVINSGSAYANGGEAIPEGVGKHKKRLYRVWQEGVLETEWRSQVPDERRIAAGLESGEFVEDHRLRDRLRRLRASDGFRRPAPAGTAHVAPRLDLVRAIDAAAAAMREQQLERELRAARNALRRRERGWRVVLDRAVEKLRC